MCISLFLFSDLLDVVADAWLCLTSETNFANCRRVARSLEMLPHTDAQLVLRTADAVFGFCSRACATGGSVCRPSSSSLQGTLATVLGILKNSLKIFVSSDTMTIYIFPPLCNQLTVSTVGRPLTEVVLSAFWVLLLESGSGSGNPLVSTAVLKLLSTTLYLALLCMAL